MDTTTTASSSCNPLDPSSIPDSFHRNSTFLCGISYPGAQPLDTLAICCTANVQVAGECFQYCPPSGRESTIFSNCVEAHVGEVDETGFKVECNGGAEVGAVEAEESGVGRRGGEGVRGWKALVLVVGLVAGWGVWG